MKYFYIICLILSSIFMCSPLYADQKTQQYAFFLPDNAFQDNSSITQINDMKPRYDNKKQTTPKTSTAPNKKNQNNVSQNNPEITLPYVKQKPNIIPPHVANKEIRPHDHKPPHHHPDSRPKPPRTIYISPRPSIPLAVKEKLKQYAIDDEFPETPTYEEEDTISEPQISLKQFKQKSLSEMLDEMPYPDYNLPSFKQLYGRYIMKLRFLHDNKVFPDNQEQEAILSKANTVKHFIVK